MISNEFKELENLSKEERELALKILSEYSNTGNSDTYNELLVSDYEEIPVDIETFLHDPRYLGKGLVNEEGRFTVYRYWVDTLKKIFPDPLKPAQYNTLALTGAIGLGKSFMAVLCGLYELYRMLCLKDPYLHYGLQPIDKITFAIMNITLDAAEGVGWDKLQQLAQSSEWFMSHGTVSKSQNPVWSPGKKIELVCGSQSRHIIGRAVFFCLDGETQILTTNGIQKLKDCVEKPIKVFNVDTNKGIITSDVCTVLPTQKSKEEICIELEDNTIIKCTPNHKFMLFDGSYKEAQYLTLEDEIIDFIPIGYIYKTTNLITGTTYVGQHKKSYFDKHYYGSGLRIQREIKKYGKSNFNVEILHWAKDIEELNDMECKYISLEISSNDKCINMSLGAKGSHENYNSSPKNYTIKSTLGKKCITNGKDIRYIDNKETIPDGWYYGNCKTMESHNMSNYYNNREAQKRNSLSKSGNKNSQWGNGDAHKGEKNGRYGKSVSEETRKKISAANTGKRYSSDINKKKGRKGISKSTEFKQNLSAKTKGKIACNNGLKNTWIMRDDPLPEGFVLGWIKK